MGEGVEKLGSWHSCWRQWWFFHKVGRELPTWAPVILLGIHPQEMKVDLTGICTPIFTAASFTVAKSEATPSVVECMDGRTNRQVYTYSGLLLSLRKDVLTYITVWMNPKDTIVSEKCRSQETNTSWFHFYEVPRAVTCIETESGVELVARGRGCGMGSGLIGVEFSFSKMEKALETGYTTRVYLPLTQLYT